MKVFIDEPHCYSGLHEGHSQIRSRVRFPARSAAMEKLAAVRLRFSLLTQKVFQRHFKEKYLEQHIVLYNIKLNGEDRVVFSGVH